MPAPRPRANPIPLEQRISEAGPSTRRLTEPPPPLHAESYAPPESPRSAAGAAATARAASSSTRTAPPPAHLQARSQDRAPSAPWQGGERGAGASSQPAPARGHHDDGGRRRGRGGKGKGRDEGRDDALANLPPPFERESSEVWVEVGPVNWGTQSREVFKNFCADIVAAKCGPAPVPVYVTKPDNAGYAKAKFVGGNYRSARENAEALVMGWGKWSHETGQSLHVTLDILD
ncbi:hypothetical protein C8R47DRAFT_1205396 [Mycena vitilis]|nr:hypothetical protein C8R47DRAFT_1205396 [Mycena vitilis]